MWIVRKSLKVSDIKCPSVSKVPVKISHTGVYVCESTDYQSRVYFIWRLMKQPADWKQLLDNQQVSRVSRWAGSAGELWSQRLSAPLKARLNSLARPAPFAHLCERAVEKRGVSVQIAVHLLFFGGVARPGRRATQVLLLPPWRPHSSIAMCCLSKRRFWAGRSQRWLATAPATCIVALCKSAHTGTEARGGGILSSVAGIEDGGRPINESLP